MQDASHVLAFLCGNCTGLAPDLAGETKKIEASTCRSSSGGSFSSPFGH